MQKINKSQLLIFIVATLLILLIVLFSGRTPILYRYSVSCMPLQIGPATGYISYSYEAAGRLKTVKTMFTNCSNMGSSKNNDIPVMGEKVMIIDFFLIQLLIDSKGKYYITHLDKQSTIFENEVTQYRFSDIPVVPASPKVLSECQNLRFGGRESCIAMYAWHTRDSSVCNKLKKEEDKNYCVEFLKNINMNKLDDIPNPF